MTSAENSENRDTPVSTRKPFRVLGNITRSVTQFLCDREYRPFYHLVCIIIILAAASLLFYKSINGHGVMMATDMTWPNTLSRIQFMTVNTWYPYGSAPTLTTPQYFLWIYPTATIAKLLHLTAARYQILTFYATFSLAGISMYTLAFKTIRSIKLPETATYAPYAGAVLSGLVYMYNPWSIQYLRPYFAYPIYAMLPLLFLLMVKTFDSPSLANIILFSLIVAWVSTSHHLVWFWALLLTYLVFFLITHRSAKEKVWNAIKAFAGITVLYSLMNAIWLLPALSSQVSGRPFVPFYGPEVTQGSVFGLSVNNSLMNNFRLLSVWPWSWNQIPGWGSFLEALLFAVPLLSILALLLVRNKIRRNNTVNYWAIMALLSLLLATGTSFFLRRFYSYLVLRAPGSQAYGWMLRASERWQFFIPIFFAMMVGILLAMLLRRKPQQVDKGIKPITLLEAIKKKDDDVPGRRLDEEIPGVDSQAGDLHSFIESMRFRAGLGAAFLVILIVLASYFPIALFFAQRVYSPAMVPKDYDNVNSFFSSQSPGTRVVWLPFFQPQSFRYSWAPERDIQAFSVADSNPSLNNIQEVMNGKSYFNWLENLYRKDAMPNERMESPDIMLKNNILTPLLIPFGAKYAVYDYSVNGFDFGDALDKDQSLTPAKRTKYLAVHQTEYNPGLIWAATRTVQAYSFFDNLAFAQRFSKEELANLAFTDGKSYFGDSPTVGVKYGAMDLKGGLQLVSDNPGFEQTNSDSTVLNWARYFPTSSLGIELDNKEKTEGKHSLKLVNTSTRQLGVDWVVGNEIPVKEGEIYAFQTAVRYRNAVWTNALIEGYKPATNEWIQLVSCPTIRAGADSNWKHYYCSFYMPGGISKIRPRLGAGWVSDKLNGPAVSWFDDVKVSRLDQQFLQSIALRGKPPEIISKKLSAEKYSVRVKGSSGPFVLVFGEAFDNHWVVKTNRGKVIRSVPLYATINGFPLENKGDFQLTIEYEPQKWVNIGLVISLFSILFGLAYLLVYWAGRGGAFGQALAATGRALKDFGSRIREEMEFPRRSTESTRKEARRQDTLERFSPRPTAYEEPDGEAIRTNASPSRRSERDSKLGAFVRRGSGKTISLGRRLRDIFEFPPRKKM